MCQHLLIKQGMQQDENLNLNSEQNRELFELEIMNGSDLGRFLNWEISHIMAVTDLASQLKRLITVQEFRPTTEVRRLLEQMMTP